MRPSDVTVRVGIWVLGSPPASRDPLFMRRGDGRGQRKRDLQQLGQVHALPRDHLRQRLAVDQFHRDEVHPLRLLDGVQGHDVRVVQPGDDLGLALEPLQTLGVAGPLFGQDLDRNFPIEGGVDRAPHFAHPAGADLGGQAVVKQALSDFDGQGGPFLRNPSTYHMREPTARWRHPRGLLPGDSSGFCALTSGVKSGGHGLSKRPGDI
jgi:hypothetical protein